MNRKALIFVLAPLGLFLLTSGIACAADAKPSNVTVSGAGNIGIGTMSGGTVNLGLTPQEAKDLATATGQEVAKQLANVVKRLNTKPDRQLEADKLSLGVAEAFLATLKGKKVPQSEWAQVFGELAREYLQLGARIQATPVTSDQIKDLVNQADEARKRGQFDKADAKLAEAAEIALQDAQRIQEQARESIRQAASLNASRATLALTQLQRTRGATLFEMAFDLRKSDVSSESFWWLVEAGDSWVIEGSSAEALRTYKKAQSAAEAGAASDPRSTEWQRDLMASNSKIGDVQSAQGDSAAALKSYQAGLVIAERLATSDPRNTEWQRYLMVSYSRIGNVQSAQGDSAAALKSYQAGLAIVERLATSDPRNTEWQRDLAVSFWKIASIKPAIASRQERRAMLSRGLSILTAQRAQGQLPASIVAWIKLFENALLDLQ